MVCRFFQVAVFLRSAVDSEGPGPSPGPGAKHGPIWAHVGVKGGWGDVTLHTICSLFLHMKVYPVAPGGGLGVSRGPPWGVENVDMLHARTPGVDFVFHAGFHPVGTYNIMECRVGVILWNYFTPAAFSISVISQD